jgi:hypothetical protein
MLSLQIANLVALVADRGTMRGWASKMAVKCHYRISESLETSTFETVSAPT